ncbi:MAG: sigma-70 family RNA polymerase sigma factor [Anaerolineae bacterium]
MTIIKLPYMAQNDSNLNLDTQTENFDSFSDIALLRRAEKLEDEPLAEIHRRYYTPVYRYVASKVGAGQLAEDFTADVFVRFIHAIRQKSAPSNSVKGWLYRVASNIVNDHYRKKYRRSYSGLTEAEPSNDLSPEDLLDGKINNDALREAIGELSSDQQNVISLRFSFGMSVAEVAESMGKSETAVRQIQFRSVRKLATIMGVDRK